MDTWCHETKRTQTNPISAKKPLTAKPKTTLTFLFTRPYAKTPQSQKQSQTNPISPPAVKKLLDDLKQKPKKYRPGKSQAAGTLLRYISTNQGQMRYKGFGTKRYDTASDAAQRARNNVAPSPLKASATITPNPSTSAALPLSLCRLNNNCPQPSLHEKSTHKRQMHPALAIGIFFLSFHVPEVDYAPRIAIRGERRQRIRQALLVKKVVDLQGQFIGQIRRLGHDRQEDKI